MAKLKITQIKSTSGSSPRQKASLRCLGIRKMNQTVEIEKNPVSEGQLAKVAHLCNVEVID